MRLFTLFAVIVGFAGCSGPITRYGPSAAPSEAIAFESAAVELPADSPSGGTLKASAPIINSPSEGALIEDNETTFQLRSARATFVNVPLDVLIELWEEKDGTLTKAWSDRRPQQGNTMPVQSPSLKGATTYHLRARGMFDEAAGPWSEVRSFKTADLGPDFDSRDDINPFLVNYIHRNIADWRITSEVTGIVMSSQICVFHTGAGKFPTSIFGGDLRIEGNVWVFAKFGAQWWGATWDWLRPGQVCKGETLRTLGRDQIRIAPMDAGWIPQPGTDICFAVSARARDEVEAGQVRTNIKCTKVP